MRLSRPNLNVAKPVKQRFIGGPWDNSWVKAWPSQVHSEYPLSGGVYRLVPADADAIERTYTWVETTES